VNRSRQIYAIMGLVVSSAWLWAQCSAETQQHKGPPRVELGRAKRTDLTTSLEKGGTVSYIEKAAVSSPLKGTLKQILVHEGDSVTEGQPLARLDTLDLELALQKARTDEASARARWKLSRGRLVKARQSAEKRLRSLKTARSNLVRARSKFLRTRSHLEDQRKIFELGGISRQELQQIYSSYLSAMTGYYAAREKLSTDKIGYRKSDLSRDLIPDEREAQKEALISNNTAPDQNNVEAARQRYLGARSRRIAAEKTLARSTIRSPISGTIATRTREPGEQVSPGKPFLTVVNTEELLISASFSEMEKPDIRIGQKAFVSADVYPQVEFQGKVHRISPVVSPETRSFQVTVIVKKDAEHPLSPGMFARIRINHRKAEDALSIPMQAILPGGECSKPVQGQSCQVFVFRNGHVFLRKVKVGQGFRSRVRILSGLAKDDSVVTSGKEFLEDGMMVRASEPDSDQ